jgi:hypothetical protein
MGRKSRNKRIRKQLRPASAVETRAAMGRRAEPRSGAKAKVMKLLEAMVDAAQEDLTSRAEKPRVSYGQALRAGELLVRYEAEEAATEVPDEFADELAVEEFDEAAFEAELERKYPPLEDSPEMRERIKRIQKEVAAERTAPTG